MLYASNTFVPYNYPLAEADVIFTGVPFASTSISKPALYGPLMVRESLKLVEDYTEGRRIFKKVRICDIGDIEIVPGSFQLTAERIRETLREIKSENESAFIIIIGGDHSVTLPVAEALKPKTIIQLDAHTDLREDYLGEKFSHATWASHASRIADLVQVGVTSMTPEAEEMRKKNKIRHFSMEEFIGAEKNFEQPVHTSIDIDVIDPSYVDTGFPEGSAKPEELLRALDFGCGSLDITEIADTQLPSRTGFIAAKIIVKVLSNVFR